MRVLVFGMAVVAALGLAPAHADATFAAEGTVSYKLIFSDATQNCSTELALSYEESGGTWVEDESYAPGTGNAVDGCAINPLITVLGGYTNAATTPQLCVPVINSGFELPPSTLSRSGSTYTIKTTYRFCDGVAALDLITMTVSGSGVTFKHDLYQNAKLFAHITGILGRVA